MLLLKPQSLSKILGSLNYRLVTAHLLKYEVQKQLWKLLNKWFSSSHLTSYLPSAKRGHGQTYKKVWNLITTWGNLHKKKKKVSDSICGSDRLGYHLLGQWWRAYAYAATGTPQRHSKNGYWSAVAFTNMLLTRGSGTGWIKDIPAEFPKQSATLSWRSGASLLLYNAVIT